MPYPQATNISTEWASENALLHVFIGGFCMILLVANYIHPAIIICQPSNAGYWRLGR
jgi:hypothetical protein